MSIHGDGGECLRITDERSPESRGTSGRGNNRGSVEVVNEEERADRGGAKIDTRGGESEDRRRRRACRVREEGGEGKVRGKGRQMGRMDGGRHNCWMAVCVY